MINLLPDNEQRMVDKEYELRVRILYLLGILVLIAFAITLLVPSFILTFYKERAFAQSPLPPPTETPEEREELSKDIAAAQLLVGALRPEKKVMQPSEIISLILKHKTRDNSITLLSLKKKEEDKAGNTMTISVQGKARNRQGLLSFTSALERETAVQAVVVPVSQFAKDTNIDFSFTVDVNIAYD